MIPKQTIEKVALSPSLMVNSSRSGLKFLILGSEHSGELKNIQISRTPSLKPRVCHGLDIIWKLVRDTAHTSESGSWGWENTDKANHEAICCISKMPTRATVEGCLLTSQAGGSKFLQLNLGGLMMLKMTVGHFHASSNPETWLLPVSWDTLS